MGPAPRPPSSWCSAVDSELRDRIPTFEKQGGKADQAVDLTNLSALTATLGGIRTWAEIGLIALVAVVIVGDQKSIEPTVRAPNLGPVTVRRADDVLGAAGPAPSASAGGN